MNALNTPSLPDSNPQPADTAAWAHRSFSAPFTTTGRSALVPQPPWHYAGWLLNVGFRFDAAQAQALVPPAAAPLRAGTRLGASLAVKDRRVFEAQATLTGAPGQALGFLAAPTLGSVGWADLRAPQRLPQPALVRPDIGARVGSGWHAATASLRLMPPPGEDLDLLGEIEATQASAGWLGLTVAGALTA